ncbi:MAG: proline--tRNA ligase [Endozoicomonadaceae bacterium]|nr:proline--tRNA ligase [Endozoicomonadaceae bacterium]
MRTTQYLLSTQKETPSDALAISHQLMLKAGLIRKLAAGLYIWLPTGTRVLNKVVAIIHQAMRKVSAQEIQMPIVQPGSLWKSSKRWHDYGLELLRFQDRHNRDFVLGPTHEEVVTELIRHEINSYKQLPTLLYQIQIKFRDEIRPRFGVMRSREFMMKDAYSFHLEQTSLDQTYHQMHDAYCDILKTLQLNYRAVEADTGSIGGHISHEFHVLAESGEDSIAFNEHNTYAANVEKAETCSVLSIRKQPHLPLKQVMNLEINNINTFMQHFDISIENTIKTYIVKASDAIDSLLIALIVRADHTLNEIKAAHLPEVLTPLQLATSDEIQKQIGLHHTTLLGPVNLPIPCIVDHTVSHMSDFYAASTQPNQYYTGINWDRDAQYLRAVDCRQVLPGDKSPDNKGILSIQKGIEVGHIFQLGEKYSQALQAKAINQQGKLQPILMGCYGLGVTRLIAAAIEQNHDKNGIIWPESIAPFSVVIVGLNIDKSTDVKQAAQTLYDELQQHNIEVLLDDRQVSSGIKLADMDLIGIPHRIVISDKTLKKQEIEYKNRREKTVQYIPINTCLTFLLRQNITQCSQ